MEQLIHLIQSFYPYKWQTFVSQVNKANSAGFPVGYYASIVPINERIEGISINQPKVNRQ